MSLSNYVSRLWQAKQEQKLDIQIFISLTLGNFPPEILKLNLTQLKENLGPYFDFFFADTD